MDPGHKLFGSMSIFKSLSRRLQTNPGNPLEKYQPPADAQPQRLPKGVIDASAAIGKAIQNWETSTGLKNEPKAVCEEAWRLGMVFSGTEAEANWPTLEIRPPPAPVIGIVSAFVSNRISQDSQLTLVSEVARHCHPRYSRRDGHRSCAERG